MCFTIEDDLTLAHTLADLAATVATARLRQAKLRTQTKADGSLVTDADQLIEAAIREQLHQHRPDDAFVGEESGTHGWGRRRWLVDPIDGTAAFAAGRADWRNLIAVEEAGVITVGLVNAPALHRRWWATRAGGAWTRSCHDPQHTPAVRLAVSGTFQIRQAVVGTWPAVIDCPQPVRAAAARLSAASKPPRPTDPSARPPSTGPAPSGGSGHGALLVATGELDAFLSVGAGPWDLAAMVPVVEEAGGQFSDITGGRSLETPAAVFSNGVLHEQILRCLDTVAG